MGECPVVNWLFKIIYGKRCYGFKTRNLLFEKRATSKDHFMQTLFKAIPEVDQFNVSVFLT